ncbi:MAG: TetR/AcrR family transcriptional regulator [Acidimicrobiales bacterium]
MAGTTTRQRYLDAVVEAMMAEGSTDLTLVVLAEAAGTSDRMLIYYFKTREALLTEAMDTIRARRRKRLHSELAQVTRADTHDSLRALLSVMSGPEHAKGTRLYFDATGRWAASSEPFPRFVEGVILDTVEEAAAAARRLGASTLGAETFGTLFCSLSTSLACDRQVTGDDERIERAVDSATASLTALIRPL